MNDALKKDPSMAKKSVRLRGKNQITIPAELIDELQLKEGEQLEIQIENGHLVLVPVITVEKDQAWFWTPEWQQEEKEIDEQIQNQEVSAPMNLEDTLASLDQLSKEE